MTMMQMSSISRRTLCLLTMTALIGATPSFATDAPRGTIATERRPNVLLIMIILLCFALVIISILIVGVLALIQALK